MSDFGCQILFFAVACVIYHRQQHNSLASFAVARVIYHGQHNNSLAPNWRKEFKPIILSLRIGGKNLSPSFCPSKLEEGISAYHFIAPNWRKVSSLDVFSLQIGGRFHHIMFSCSKLEEGFIA